MRERIEMVANRQRFILKSGLLLSGESEGGAGRGMDGTEAAILPQSVQYRRASANCSLRPYVPNKVAGTGRKITFSRKDLKNSELGFPRLG